MNFGFSEEQELQRAEVRKYLDEQCPMEVVRGISETVEGYSAQQWKQIGELGWLGLIVPEEYGGAGLGWIDLVAMLEETGRSLFPSPLISNTLAAAALIESGNAEQRRRWLPGLADGSCIGTLALVEGSDDPTPRGVGLRAEPDADGFVLTGEKRFVADAGSADLFVVAFRTGDAEQDCALAVVEADANGVSTNAVASIDETKRTGSLVLDGVQVKRAAVLGEAGSGAAAIERLVDLGAIAVSAEIVGAADGALELTVQYAKDRVQFGSPIGRYQGVKHPLAEAYVDIVSTKSLLYYAAWAVDKHPEQIASAAAQVKGFATDAFTQLGVTGIQLHGAVGYTKEYDIQLYLRRSKWARPMFGDEDFHFDRVATMGGI